jgi:hypothetical protein
VPLSYYTPDGRNDALFGPGTYGVRIAWLGSTPPASNFTIGGKSYSWSQQGTYDAQKMFPRDFRYSYTNVAMPTGQQTVVVGSFQYHLLIPHAGTKTDTDVMFVGDINLNDGGSGMTGAQAAYTKILSKTTDAVSLMLFPGDVFYHDDDFIAQMWAGPLSDASRPITNYLVAAVPGNHDYEVNGCGGDDCKWTREGACGAIPVANAMWLALFFATDAMKSFEGLQHDGKPGCKVPMEYSLQIYVVGRTCIVMGDNVWLASAAEGALDWSSVNARIAPVVDTVIICTHWNGINLGAASTTMDWTNALAKHFPGKRVFADTNHTHQNSVTSKTPASLGQAMSGGNGFGGGPCLGNAACCPSIWRKDQTWVVGGYGAGEVCEGMSSATLSTGEFFGSDTTARQQLEAFNADASLPLSEQELIRWFAPPVLADEASFPRRRSIEEVPAPPDWDANVTVSPIHWYPPQMSPEVVGAYKEYYAMRNGYPRCDRLATVAPSQTLPGYTCWNDHLSPWDVFKL